VVAVGREMSSAKLAARVRKMHGGDAAPSFLLDLDLEVPPASPSCSVHPARGIDTAGLHRRAHPTGRGRIAIDGEWCSILKRK